MRHTTKTAAALAAFALLASCRDGDPQSPAAGADGASGTTATPETSYTVIGEPHVFGPGRWALTAFGDPDAPMPVFNVPAGFQGRESWVWTDEDGPRSFGQVAYMAVTRVLRNPCDFSTAYRPGRTVENLATALAAQKRTTTTEPVAVTVDGYDGLYLELTTPSQLDRRCRTGEGVVIFESGNDDDRGLEPSVTDRYWILDVRGHRVVIAALTRRHANPETVELLTGLVEGTSFVEAG